MPGLCQVFVAGFVKLQDGLLALTGIKRIDETQCLVLFVLQNRGALVFAGSGSYRFRAGKNGVITT